jgi:hypothetical protein
MRFESPTGGALGQIAIQELEWLQQTIGSLKQDQDPEALKEKIAQVKAQYKRAASTMRKAIAEEREFLAKRGAGQSGSTQNGSSSRLRFNVETGELE